MKFLNKFRKKKEPEKVFPPIPDWKPDIVQPMAVVIETIKYYTDGKRDFAIFKNGTFVIVPEGLREAEVKQLAKESLHNVFHAHPDMHPQEMDDGNILVGYNHNVANVVLNSEVQKHWKTIDDNHQRALATSEVLITPFGNNVFDDFGKKALFGRCFMFMDAKNPKIIQVVRKRI